MPQAHLIVGATGAGKTTYAQQLVKTGGGIRFSIDEWMKNLFRMDAPNPPTYAWMLERVERCEAQALEVASQALGQGVDVVLDLGFFSQAQRSRVNHYLAQQKGKVKLHYLDIPAATRWERVKERNAQKGETFTMDISAEVFQFAETLFETPTAEELKTAVVIRLD